MKVACIIEYDGAAFCGWQTQDGVRTIQTEFHRAVEMVLRQKIPPINASGRTDSGVHARGQVIDFEVPEGTDLQALAHAVSCILRGEVSVRHIQEVPESFHSRMCAESKQYRYTILYRANPPTLQKGQVWHQRGELNLERMKREAASLVGTHDFSSLRGHGCSAKSPIREVLRSEWRVEEDLWIYVVVGRGFLKQMVRNIVGTLVAQGRGTLSLTMPEILEKKDRKIAGATAPACGLSLQWVQYSAPFEALNLHL